MMGFWDAMASAGPYANNLRLAPGGQFFCRGQAPLASPLAPGWKGGEERREERAREGKRKRRRPTSKAKGEGGEGRVNPQI